MTSITVCKFIMIFPQPFVTTMEQSHTTDEQHSADIYSPSKFFVHIMDNTKSVGFKIALGHVT